MKPQPPRIIAEHHSPTRSESIAAAHLLEFDPRLTRTVGIAVPVAITPAAWTAAVAPTHRTTDPA